MNVDNTVLESVSLCSTKCAIEYVLHRRPREESAALKAGSAVHKALEYYFGYELVWNRNDIHDSITALEIFDTEYKQWSEEQVELKENLMWGNVRRCLEEWFRRLDKTPIPFKVLSSEQAFKLDLGNDLCLTGLIDVLGEDTDNGMLVICDHKTTSALNKAFSFKPGWASQFSGYIFAVQQIMKRQVYGVYVNAIDLKGIPTSNRKCKEHGCSYEQCGPEHLMHQWIWKQRSIEQLKLWWIGLHTLANKFRALRSKVKTIADLQDTPMEGMFNGTCYGYNKCCEFYDYCHVYGKRADMLESMTVEKEWNPLEGKTVIEGSLK